MEKKAGIKFIRRQSADELNYNILIFKTVHLDNIIHKTFLDYELVYSLGNDWTIRI